MRASSARRRDPSAASLPGGILPSSTTTTVMASSPLAAAAGGAFSPSAALLVERSVDVSVALDGGVVLRAAEGVLRLLAEASPAAAAVNGDANVWLIKPSGAARGQVGLFVFVCVCVGGGVAPCPARHSLLLRPCPPVSLVMKRRASRQAAPR